MGFGSIGSTGHTGDQFVTDGMVGVGSIGSCGGDGTGAGAVVKCCSKNDLSILLCMKGYCVYSE